MTASATETCANCGTAIGKLETPCVWQEHVVCAACHAKTWRITRQHLR